MSALDDALARPALTVDGRDYAVADVAAAALYLSEWSGVERRACAGTASLDRGDAPQPTEEDVSAAAAAFRRARRLLSAEEMEEWLARRGLTAGAWMRWVRADLGRRRAEEAGGPQQPESGPVTASALWAEALCSGALARSAQRLAELLVAPELTDEAVGREQGKASPDPAPLSALGVDPERARAMLDVLPARRVALDRLAERVATPQAVDERLRARQTDWLAVDFRVLALTEETAAREALLCVRDDGLALEEVAQLARAELTRERTVLADAPPALQAHLLSAGPGELVGPLERDGHLAVLIVDAKLSPSPGDPEVSRRARTELLDRALDREMTTRVRRHDRL
ncbi:MAG: hypothetical protein WD844_01930 [Thermoleophilaceae bacterium]